VPSKRTKKQDPGGFFHARTVTSEDI